MEMKTYADTGLVSQIARSLWPVGAIYSSTVNVSPADLFGFGVWEPIRGVFLLAENDEHPAGSTGGEFEHVLTVDEMPTHTHMSAYLDGQATTQTIRANALLPDSVEIATLTYRKTQNRTVLSEGGSIAHNNTPPPLGCLHVEEGELTRVGGSGYDEIR